MDSLPNRRRELYEDISALRSKLCSCDLKKGDNKELLKLSQQLDKLIILYFNKKLSS